MRHTLIESGAGASCLIAIDNLEKLASKTDLLQALAELKELAESLGIVVIGGASKVELVHEKSADMAASFVVDSDGAVLEVTTLGEPEPRELRFDYDPATHRFAE
jgi:selenophosphate synthetase-related protein